MKKIFLLAFLLTVFYFPAARAWAAEGQAAPAPATSAIANKYCPVSGDKVSGKDFLIYGGKRYNFCCKDCIRKFKKDPQKYLKKSAGKSS